MAKFIESIVANLHGDGGQGVLRLLFARDVINWRMDDLAISKHFSNEMICFVPIPRSEFVQFQEASLDCSLF